MNTPLDDLKQDLRAGIVTLLVGSGVSKFSTHNDPSASWIGMLQEGLQRVASHKRPDTDPVWVEHSKNLLMSGTTDNILNAAEGIVYALKRVGRSQYHRWITETVGALKTEDPRLLKEIENLHLPILTTNYDKLLEEQTGRPAITSEDRNLTWKFINGKHNGIYHIHGVHDAQNSLVITPSDYKSLLHDDLATNSLRLIASKPLLVIGAGGTLEDPTFDTLLNWLATCFGDTELQHYRLVRTKDLAKVQKDNLSHIFLPIPYGNEHKDLPKFLANLRRTPSYILSQTNDSTPTIQRTDRIKDCAWGCKPVTLSSIGFTQETQAVTRLFDNGTTGITVYSKTSRELSSFLVKYALIDTNKNRIISRIECKKWIQFDEYLFQILHSFDLLKEYQDSRAHNVGEWGKAERTKLLVETINKKQTPFLLLLEHIDRLDEDSRKLFACVSDRCNTLLLLAGTTKSEALDIGITEEKVTLGPPTETGLRMLAENILASQHIQRAASIFTSAPRHGTTALQMCCWLLNEDANMSDNEAQKLWASTFDEIFNRVIAKVKSSSELRSVCAACCVVRTRRKLDLLAALCPELDRQVLVRTIHNLGRTGLLIVDENTNEISMSAGVRHRVTHHLFSSNEQGIKDANDNPEYTHFNRLVANYYYDALNQGKPTILAEIIPFISIALFHYSEGKAWNRYAEVLNQFRDQILYTWHFDILYHYLEPLV